MLPIRDCRWPLGAVAFVAALAGVALVVAGPLNPPSGAVTSTYKTLTEVEPRIAINSSNTPGDADSVFRIRQPGSYYLTGNVTGASGKMGIEIEASYVTLDLNGFDVKGVTGALDGISCTQADAIGIAVVNGKVRDWPANGIDCSSAIVTGGRIEGVAAVGNGARGIAAGNGFTLINCSSVNNTTTGIDCAYATVVTNCVASGNGGVGMYSFGKCSFAECSASINGGYGFSAIAEGTTFTNCTANANTGDGFYLSNGCIVSECTSTYNQGSGYLLSTRCKVLDSNAHLNGTSASGANIKVSGLDNHVVGNSCSGASRGIQVTAQGNFISRNICSGSVTNWDIAAGNTCLVVSAATNTTAWSGNSGGAAPGSTDPNANFTY
ncbi:MAG: right-handed parallel beta-helix repeat-containing protein [Phycisphaerales bacterium]